jgi:hypothetical protein
VRLSLQRQEVIFQTGLELDSVVMFDRLKSKMNQRERTISTLKPAISRN